MDNLISIGTDGRGLVRGPRLWLMRLLLVVVTGAIVLLAGEVALRLVERRGAGV
jgi:hypothetical protein